MVGTAACALTFTFWNSAARGGVTLGMLLFSSLFCLACVLAGRSAARLVGLAAARDVPTVFLFGFLLLNSALYLLAWISPFSILVNALVLLAAVFAWPLFQAPAARPAAPELLGERTGLLALGICLVAATLWAQDSLAPEVITGDTVVLRPWFDSYFHTCEIRMFRDAHGAATLHDVRMAGRPVWVYHHASYLVPALVSAATGTRAFLTYGSFMVPAGLLLSGLAAYALVRSLWGGGAGVAAAAALLLLPDASYHGLGNHFLSYHWLQQIAPGGLYGAAVLAIAWLLVFAGCRAGRAALVALGLVTAGVAAHFKVHLFVAAAPLLWLYPGVFFRGASPRWKAAWLVFALASLVSAVQVAQRFEPVPVLRLDGSSIKEFLRYLVVWIDDAGLRSSFSRFTPTSSFLGDVAWGSILLGYGALGLYGIAIAALVAAVLGRRLLRRPRVVELEHVAFPLLIVLNWLLMSMGLAYNTKDPQHQDELLHRPFVWAYFVVAAWSGGLAYRLFLDGPARRSRAVRVGLAAGLVPLLIVPFVFGVSIQFGSVRWGKSLAFRPCPRGLYECARFVREVADAGDLVEDSEDDPSLLFSALCERPSYACAYFEGKPDRILSARIEELKAFKALTDPASIRRFALEHRIRWYVLQPATDVAWPVSVLADPAFNWSGYCVFQFEPSRDVRTGGSGQRRRLSNWGWEAGPGRGQDPLGFPSSQSVRGSMAASCRARFRLDRTLGRRVLAFPPLAGSLAVDPGHPSRRKVPVDCSDAGLIM